MRLGTTRCYSQMPALSAADRAMIDALAVTCEGRLTVLELKAEEDIHLPLQGLDSWSRVAWHRSRGEFQRFGYFPDRDLHYVPPEIDWMLLGIDEHGRQRLRVIFRKRPGDAKRIQSGHRDAA